MNDDGNDFGRTLTPADRALFEQINRSRNFQPDPRMTIKRWVVDLTSEEILLCPSARVTRTNRSMVHNFRPMHFVLSAPSCARIDIELRIMSEIYPLGMCDSWGRNPAQKATSFVLAILGAPTVGPPVEISAVLHSRMRKLTMPVSVQIWGIYDGGEPRVR